MLRAVRSGGSTITSTQTTIKTSDVGPIPQQLAARLVGFLEYGTALDHLDRLLAVVSPEEIAVIEEIVKQRDEFIVYTNLSRRYEDDFVRAVKGDRAKHGLGWVTALARVELGAMRAGFTDERNPFERVPPSRYELPQYAEILFDSARTHYLALGNDPVAQGFARWSGPPITPGRIARGERLPTEQQAIAYARRTVIASQFVDAVESLGRSQLTPEQYIQLQQAKQNLESLRSAIVYRVLRLGVDVISSTSSSQLGAGSRILGRVSDSFELPESGSTSSDE